MTTKILIAHKSQRQALVFHVCRFKEIGEYGEKCRIEAMELFTKWMPYLRN